MNNVIRWRSVQHPSPNVSRRALYGAPERLRTLFQGFPAGVNRTLIRVCRAPLRRHRQGG
jgi:hypothetical protein